jgi:hypothetical protein
MWVRLLLWVAGLFALGSVTVLAAEGALMPVQQREMAQYRIFAYRDWQSVGIRLQPDDSVRIRAAGEWSYTPDEFHGPEGHARYPAPDFYPVPFTRGGVLIAKIGEDGEPFQIGARGTAYGTTTGGMLYLRINDDILSDNQGWVNVTFQSFPADRD